MLVRKMWLENAHSLTSTVENQSLETDIPLYFSGGTRTLHVSTVLSNQSVIHYHSFVGYSLNLFV